MIYGRLPSVPEYYQEYIDKSVDLSFEPKQCCPFHQESTPSFSYNRETGRWSCFGKCHAHGDVIDMHQRKFKFATRDEAEHDLCVKYNVPIKSVAERFSEDANLYLDENKLDSDITYAKACILANTVERWIEMDKVMSVYPYDKTALKLLINKWQGFKSIWED